MHHYLLNSKPEINRCTLPRLGLKMEDKEYKDNKKEEKADLEKDEEL